MWTYIVRRLLLMIPTLFGVTVVSFCIMQLAPGDPLLDQMGPQGNAGSGQTREAFLIQKRDLKLDKPLLLNFHNFRDYTSDLKIVAYFLSRTPEEIEQDLTEFSKLPADDKSAAGERLAFLRKREIPEFEKRLIDPKQHPRLANHAVIPVTQVFSENLGIYGAPAAFKMLEDPETSLPLRIGLIRALNHMIVDPFQYTYSRDPLESQTAAVATTWSRWWERSRKDFPPLDADRQKVLEQQFRAMVDEPAQEKIFTHLEKFDRDDAPFLVERLLNPQTPIKERALCAVALKLLIAAPLRLDVPVRAKDVEVAEAVDNWKEYFTQHQAEFQPGFGTKLANVFADTQYAHMLWRLATFNFGRSALRTREPVSEKIWDAVKVSAPLMFMTEILIYGISVPLGIICAVWRGRFLDRAISLKLFLLFSIPPFVAGMLFQLYFCTEEYTGWMRSLNSWLGTNLQPFPMYGLHSDKFSDFWQSAAAGAVQNSTPGLWAYLKDYLWHATLPVVCLSLFSLAGLAMYGRTSMLDVLGQDFVRTARAKGLPEWKVILKHALRNGLIPLLTLFSSFLPALLGGSVLIEVLFNIPGMGRLSWGSIDQKDFPTLMALVYIDAIVVMLSILATDLLYVVVDPRISYSGRDA